MKFTAAILLISLGAISASLVQEANPVLASANLHLRLVAPQNKALGDLLQNLQQQANQILGQIQTAVQQGQQQAAALVSQFQQAAQQVAAAGGNAAQQVQAIVQNLLQQIAQVLSNNQRNLEQATRLSSKLNLGQLINQTLQHALSGHLTTDQINTVISLISAQPGNHGQVISQLVQLLLEAARPKTATPELPADLQEQIEKARKGELTADQIGQLISKVAPYPGTAQLIFELAQLMLDQAIPSGRSADPALPTYLQQQVQLAREHKLTADQINSLISQVSVYPGTGPLVGELTQLMLDAARPNRMRADPPLPADLEAQVQLARQHKFTADQINTLISKVSVYPGTLSLVGELTQLMLDAARPNRMRADPPLPADLEAQVQLAREHKLTADQINTLISKVSVYPETGSLVGELTQLMLEAAKPTSRAAVPELPADLQEEIEKARRGKLSSDQISMLISKVVLYPGTYDLVVELAQLMLTYAIPNSRAVAPELPADLMAEIEKARQGKLTSDEISQLVSKIAVYPGTNNLVAELVDLMLQYAIPSGRSAAPVLPAYLQEKVDKARRRELNSNQMNTLISQVSVFPNTGRLVDELTQIMLEVSRPNKMRADPPLPADLEAQVQLARQHKLTADQINTLISKVSVYPGTGPLVGELTQLMLDAARPNRMRADPPLPADLEAQVQLARQHKLTSDQINTLISKVSVYPGTGSLVGELTQLMLEASRPNTRAAIPYLPANLQEQIEKARRGELTADQINTLISQVAVYPGTGPLVFELAQLMLSVSVADVRGISDVLSTIGAVLDLLGSTAENTYTALQTIVQDFVSNAVASTGSALETAVSQLINALRPFQSVLGDLYTTIVEIANNLVSRPDNARYLF